MQVLLITVIKILNDVILHSSWLR